MKGSRIGSCAVAMFVLSIVLVGWVAIQIYEDVKHVPTPSNVKKVSRVITRESEGERKESENVGDVCDCREVMCWGDSLTEGVGADIAVIQTDSISYDASYKSYPEILHDLCGLSVFNCGVAGATSEEIVGMREGNPFDEEGDAFDVFDSDVVEIGQEHTGDILVVEIGSNGGWDGDYDKLIDQYWRIINYSGCEAYIVVGDTDDPGTSLGDTDQSEFDEGDIDRETEWECALKAEFGDHFVNTRLFLIEHGLEVCGLKKDSDDERLNSFGCISQQLRSDWTHLNSFGYYAKAFAIHKRGIALGYWGDNQT